MTSKQDNDSQNSCSAEVAQKILSPTSYDEGFHFFCPDGHYTGETAMSLCSFLRDLDSVDIESIRFHFDRSDFQRWIKNILHDEELAKRIDRLDKRIPDEHLQKQLRKVVQDRISELQHTH